MRVAPLHMPFTRPPVPKSRSQRAKISEYQLQRLEELYQAKTHPSRGAKETLAQEIDM